METLQTVWEWILRIDAMTVPKKPDFMAAGWQWGEQKLTEWLTQQVVQLTTWLGSILLSTPQVAMDSPGWQTVYRMVATAAYAAAVPVLAWVALQVVAGMQDHAALTGCVKRLVFMPIVVELTPRAVGAVMDLCNRVARAIVEANGAAQVPAANTQGAQLGLILLMVIVYGVLLMRLVLYYAYRYYAVMVLTALAPLAMLVWIAPGGENRLTKWKDEIVALLVTQVVHALELLLLIVMTVGVGSAAQLQGFPLLTLQIGAVLYMLRTPELLREFMSRADPVAEIRGLVASMRSLRRSVSPMAQLKVMRREILGPRRRGGV